jgi:hypothetical protein
MARHARPTRDEFSVEGDEVTHIPTGATWSAYEGQPEPSHVRDAMLGSVLPNGDDYRPHEVEKTARQLLRERLDK